MPSYKIYSTEQYINFLKLPFGSNFGQSPEKMADWFMGQPGSGPVRRSYGITKDWLVKTGIPTLNRELGGALIFLVYTVTEAGGAGNWINHYMSDTASGALGTMMADINYIKSVWTSKAHGPAMSAPEVGGVYGEDVPGQTRKVYNEVPGKSIGNVIMPSTMAGNSWVFGEKWSLARQGPRPPAVYYGNPYNEMIKVLKDAGVDPFKGAAPSGGDNNTNPEPDGGGGNSAEGIILNGREVFEAMADIARDVVKKAIENFQAQVNIPIYDNSIGTKSAGNMKATKVGNTRYQLRINDDWVNQHKRALETDILQRMASEFGKLQAGTENPTPPAPSAPSAPSGGGDAPSDGSLSDKVQKALNQVRAYGQQKARVGDGQCYALTGWYAWMIDGKDISFNNGHPVRRAIGDTLNAANIGSGWDWSGWRVINAPVSVNQLQKGAIYNIKSSYGAPFFTIGYGHTGIITSVGGGKVEVAEQNALGSLRSQVAQYDAGALAAACQSIIIPPK